jgi:naphthalene 1,2-dioxygenase ferredoxin component
MSWHPIFKAEDLEEGMPRAVVCEGKRIALFRVGEEVHATAELCTHAAVSLCDGWQEGAEIECPLHQARFDVRSGAALCAPATQALVLYPAREREGQIEIELA